MDGAGRLARSLRPQADLKAAAIGAVVLLREYLGLRPRTRKATLEREAPNRIIALLERYLPRRFGFTATVLMLLGSAGLGVVKGGHVDTFTAALGDTRNALANSAGFRITPVPTHGPQPMNPEGGAGAGA